MLLHVELPSAAKHPTGLSSAVCVAVLHDRAVTLKLEIW
jgi:hypothetical protein